MTLYCHKGSIVTQVQYRVEPRRSSLIFTRGHAPTSVDGGKHSATLGEQASQPAVEDGNLDL